MYKKMKEETFSAYHIRMSVFVRLTNLCVGLVSAITLKFDIVDLARDGNEWILSV